MTIRVLLNGKKAGWNLYAMPSLPQEKMVTWKSA